MLHHEQHSTTAAEIAERRKRFMDGIAKRAAENANRPVVVAPAPVPRAPSQDDIAFGPNVVSLPAWGWTTTWRGSSVKRVMAEVAEFYGVTVLDIRSPRRSNDIVRPRHVAMYLCRHMTARSLPEIGRQMGGKDHTTVLHAVNRITELRKIEPRLNDELDVLSLRLRDSLLNQ